MRNQEIKRAAIHGDNGEDGAPQYLCRRYIGKYIGMKDKV